MKGNITTELATASFKFQHLIKKLVFSSTKIQNHFDKFKKNSKLVFQMIGKKRQGVGWYISLKF